MRAKFKVLSGERLCEKAFGADLGEFDGSKSAFACEFNGSKSAFASEFKGSKNTLASKFDGSKGAFVSDKSYKSTLTSKIKNSKNAFVSEFDSHENAVASQKGALMSAFKTHLSELKRAFASYKGIFLGKCQKGEFESKRVKKKLWRRNFSLSLSLSR